MRFAFQQLLALFPIFVGQLIGLAQILVPDSPLEPLSMKNWPEIAQGLTVSLFGFALIRYLCWASWGTPRGEIVLRYLGMRGFVRNERPNRLERWWFHVDDHGQLR